MVGEVRSIDLPKGEVFNRLKDYFLMKGLRIAKYHEPNYMKVEVGKWIGMSFGNSKGNVRIGIKEKNRRSYIIFDFNFTKDYLANILFGLGFWMILGFLIVLYTAVSFDTILIFLIPGVFSGLIGLAISSWDVPKTRSKFMEDIDKYFRGF